MNPKTHEADLHAIGDIPEDALEAYTDDSSEITHWIRKRKRRHIILTIFGSYLIGVTTVCIPVGLRHGWDIILTAIGYFPMGLFYFFRIRSESIWYLVVGYAIYLVLASSAILFRSKTLMWLFVLLVLINVKGCLSAM